MYSSFTVRRFRGLGDLRVDGFERLNLITGRNNVGKTSLLEALFIHSGAANVNLPFTVEFLRGVTQFQDALEDALSGLFTEFDARSPIRLEGIDKVGLIRTCELRLIAVPSTVPSAGAQTS